MVAPNWVICFGCECGHMAFKTLALCFLCLLDGMLIVPFHFIRWHADCTFSFSSVKFIDTHEKSDEKNLKESNL